MLNLTPSLRKSAHTTRTGDVSEECGQRAKSGQRRSLVDTERA